MFVPGSIRETVPSRLLTTQTAPAPVAIPLGPLPTGIVSTTAFVPGSIRDTVWPSALVTQYAPSPAATAVGVAPTPVCRDKATRARVDDAQRVAGRRDGRAASASTLTEHHERNHHSGSDHAGERREKDCAALPRPSLDYLLRPER